MEISGHTADKQKPDRVWSDKFERCFEEIEVLLLFLLIILCPDFLMPTFCVWGTV